MSQANTQARAQTAERTANSSLLGVSVDTELVGILGAVALGMALLFAAGFAQASVMHDTAHDQRHAISFPCH